MDSIVAYIQPTVKMAPLKYCKRHVSNAYARTSKNIAHSTHTDNGYNNNRDEKIDRLSAYVFLLRARVVRGCTEFTVVLLNRSGLGRNNRH